MSRAIRLLWSLTQAARPGERVPLADLLDGLGRQSFPLLVLAPSLLLVSPLSAIPGMTGSLGLIIALLLAQRLAGRSALWLPRRALQRITIPVDRLERALHWLRRPAARLDRLLHPRLEGIASGRLSLLPMAVIAIAACFLPLMEFVPMSGTTVGASITLFAAGMLARDGVFVIVGASLAALLPLCLWLLLT